MRTRPIPSVNDIIGSIFAGEWVVCELYEVMRYVVVSVMEFEQGRLVL